MPLDIGVVQQAAATHALAYLAAWSSPENSDGTALRPYYAPMIDFYGSQISIDKLMAEKLRFASRWPVRDYRARTDSMMVKCTDEHTCYVQGVLDWRASNGVTGTHSSGVAQFSMGFRDGLVAVESGKVLSRE